MEIVDVNVLVYAHREDSLDHTLYRTWLIQWTQSDAAFGISELVLSGFLRIVTHPKVFNQPTPLLTALAFVDAIRSQPTCVLISPGPRHWEIFSRLCREANVKGNLGPDAYLAAMAIESGSEWITTDRDYSRFSGLRWRHPLH
ncbi:TA system VapC family ribonuclease toxin [Candidatus Nitrospira salsa]